MDRPYVKGLILSSIDGRIDGDFFSHENIGKALSYFSKLRKENAYDALLNGSVTASQIYANGYRKRSYKKASDFNDHIVLSEDKYVVCIDPEGTLNWRNDTIERGSDRLKVIEVLLEEADEDYLEQMRKLNISYIFVGRKQIDFDLLMKKLKNEFKIDSLLVTGGGVMNYSLLSNGLLDEADIILAPIVSGQKDVATVFDRAAFTNDTSIGMKLKECKELEDGVVLLKYVSVK